MSNPNMQNADVTREIPRSRIRPRTARSKPSLPKRSAGAAENHIHLPSVHLRRNGAGIDYEEDLYVGLGHVERVIRLAVIEGGAVTLVRETRGILCAEEIAQLEEDLPILMDEDNPAAQAIMEDCARNELARQVRIAAGGEHACAGCGCSETRACSGGCFWATETLCSRCV